MRHIDDTERRNRLARRHGIHPAHRFDGPVQATRAMTVLHATEAASVHLAIHARTEATSPQDVDCALYTDRTLVKQLAMRHTLFAFPRDQASRLPRRPSGADPARRRGPPHPRPQRCALAHWQCRTRRTPALAARLQWTDMKYGLNIPPFTDAATVVDWAGQAEASGWDGVFLWDHLQWNPGVEPLDPWVLLGAMAQVTERVRLGTLVTPLSRRRPHMVAKHLVTLDHLSGGRAVLGVGLGDPVDRDFEAVGEEANARTRAAMLDESLAIIDSLLQGPTEFAGEHYRVEADFRPRPLQRPRPPIWVGGVVPNRRPLARARRWDGVAPDSPNGHVTPEELAKHLAADGHPAREGWDVVVPRTPGVPAQEYADAGATWLIDNIHPHDDWKATITQATRSGPQR